MTGHEKRCKHLTSEDREEIQTGLNVGMAFKQIYLPGYRGVLLDCLIVCAVSSYYLSKFWRTTMQKRRMVRLPLKILYRFLQGRHVLL